MEEMEQINVSFKYTPQDLQKAFVVHYSKNNPISSRFTLFVGIILLMVGFLLVILQYMAGIVHWTSWSFLIYGSVVIAYYYWRFSRMGKTAFFKRSNFQNNFEFLIDEKGVHIEGGNAPSTNTWDKYYKAIVTPEMLLLYKNKKYFVLLPKKYFTDEQYLYLMRLVRNNVKRK